MDAKSPLSLKTIESQTPSSLDLPFECYNIMVCGAAGIGKSCFINLFRIKC